MFTAASASSWLTDTSPLKVLITRATYPSLHEPNYAINLEVAEYVNQKKANTPREAAMTIANLVNHRNPHIAMLALALLDTLVQSCGYPFHLQISTKEFLNELVRRFPERPPPFPGPVMTRILELVHGWKEGICADSRWREDLGNIRDMHRLLTFKGYRFRDMGRQPNLAATATTNLKTAEELESEDREAQSAKLQELIRRGTPRDLAQAQELMKSLAGANPDAKPDYKSQALKELQKLESKVILLNEMLDNATPGEKLVQGDAYDQVSSILAGARPKIQGWISNAESDDPESLDTFLQINDQINTVLSRYEAFKKGDYVAASNPIPAELSNTNTANSLSLIDFDDPSPSGSGSGTAGQATTINELESLFGSSSSAPAAPPIIPSQGTPAFPMGVGMQNPTSAFPPGFANPAMGGMTATFAPTPPQPYHIGATTPPGTQNGAIRLGTPQLSAQNTGTGPRVVSSTPNYFGTAAAPNPTPMGMTMGAMSSNGVSGAPFMGAMHTNVMTPSQQPPQPTQTHPQQATTGNAGQAQGKDPFADLAGLF